MTEQNPQPFPGPGPNQPNPGHQPQGYPPPGHQPQGYPPPGYPPPGYQPQGYPPPGYPPPGYPPPGYPPPGYQPPGYTPPAPKPPLDARQKSGARLAGILGFLLLKLGGTMLLGSILVLFVGAVFGASLGAAGTGPTFKVPGGYSLDSLLSGVSFETIAIVLGIVAAAGLGLVVASLFLSERILRSRGVERSWSVTWAAAGTALVADFLLSRIVGLLFNVVILTSDDPAGGNAVVIFAVWLAVLIVIAAVVGWLSWWWMAHLMRQRVQ